MARKPQSNGAVPDGWEMVQPTTAATTPPAADPVAPPPPDQSGAPPAPDAGAGLPPGFQPVDGAPPAAKPDPRFGGLPLATTGPELMANLRKLTARRAPAATIMSYMDASNVPMEGRGFDPDVGKKYDAWLRANPGKRPTINWSLGPPVKGPNKTSGGQAFFDGVKSGSLFGWDDEISGQGAALGNWLGRNTPVNRLLGVFGRKLDEGSGDWATDAERERAGRDQEKTDAWNEHPVLYGTGYATGVVPTLALPGGRVANAATKTGRVAGAAGVGGLYGAISGAGNDSNDRIGGAEAGGAGGALFGTLAPPLARFGGKLLYRAGDATGINALVRDGLSGALDTLQSRAPQNVQDLASRLATRRQQGFADNPLVDLVDEPGAATIRAAASRNTPGRTAAVDFANARRANVQDETARIARNISPTSEPTADVVGRIEKSRSALADDQYAQFRDTPVPVTPDLRRVLDTGAGRKALAGAIETSDNPAEVAGFLSALKRGNEPSELDRVMSLLPEGMAPAARDQVRAQLTAQGVKAGEPLPTFTVDMLDRVKRGLQARSNSPDASGQSRILNQMVGTLISEGEKAAPGYGAARGNFKAASGLVDAADTGTRALTGGNPDEAVAANRALSDEPTPMMKTRDVPGTLTVDAPPTTSEAALEKMAQDHADQYGIPLDQARTEIKGYLGDRDPKSFTSTDTKVAYTLPDGRKITGTISRAPGSRDGVINIDGVPNWDDVRNTYGTGTMRDMIYALRQQMPDLDNLRGFRVTGTKAGTAASEANTGMAGVSVKPQIVAGPSARSIARTAARRQFENTANESPRSALGLADKTAVGTNMLNRMESLVGPDAANTMRAEAGTVRSRYDRAQYVSPNTGSQTATRGADADLVGGLIDFGLNAASGGKVGLVRAVARHLNNAGIGNRNAERLVTLALDPARVDDAIAYLARKTDKQTARKIVMSIAAAQGGGRASAAPLDSTQPSGRELTDPINLEDPVN